MINFMCVVFRMILVRMDSETPSGPGQIHLLQGTLWKTVRFCLVFVGISVSISNYMGPVLGYPNKGRKKTGTEKDDTVLPDSVECISIVLFSRI